MAASSGTASTCGRLRDRRSSRIKSSSAARALVELAPGTSSAGSLRLNDSAPAGCCALLPAGSAAKATAILKQSKKTSVLTSRSPFFVDMRSQYHNPAERQPKSKHQTPKKFQAANPNSARDVAALELVIWNLSGVWSLVFGALLPPDLESLVEHH